MDRTFETDRFPVIRAKHFGKVSKGTLRKVRLIVVHSMEAPEKGNTAEVVAKYFARGEAMASAHLCIDSDSIVQCVFDNDIAYAAPGANHDGIQLELAGYARQTKKEWLDPYGILMLNNAANAAAQYCLKYSLPIKHISDKELKEGAKGIVGHVQVSKIYKKSSHTDPGIGFPWDYFLERIQLHSAKIKKERKVG